MFFRQRGPWTTVKVYFPPATGGFQCAYNLFIFSLREKGLAKEHEELTDISSDMNFLRLCARIRA
jgi:hypothetical protein